MSKLMIVDDAAFMRESIKMMIKGEGFDIVAEAANGEEAIQKYLECAHDIMTMDITLPVIDGIEALKAIKAKDPVAKVIMVSAMGQEPLIREAVISGASNFIVKPFQKAKLLEVLNSLAKA